MKFRPKLVLRKGATLAALIVPAAGCANTPAEAFRASIDDVCAATTACGRTDEDCATPASRRAVFDDINDELADDSEACRDTVFEVYADYYVCFSNLSCELLTSTEDEAGISCFSTAMEARIETACPDIDL